MCLNRQKTQDRLGQNVTMDTHNFEKMELLKYLEADNNITEEIKGRMHAVNKCMYSLNNIMKSKRVTRTWKIKIFKSII